MELSASDDSPPTAGLRSRDDRRAGGVPVYVMLPLDTVSREGELRAVEQLAPRLEQMRDAGVEGVMIDVWWGIVERRAPRTYDWAPYVALAALSFSVGAARPVWGAARDTAAVAPGPGVALSGVQQLRLRGGKKTVEAEAYAVGVPFAARLACPDSRGPRESPSRRRGPKAAAPHAARSRGDRQRRGAGDPSAEAGYVGVHVFRQPHAPADLEGEA